MFCQRSFFCVKTSARYYVDKKIWQCGKKYQAMQGAYPVIMLTFKDVKYGTKQSGNIMSVIEKSVYLCDAKRLQEALRKYMITSIAPWSEVAFTRIWFVDGTVQHDR